MAGLLLAIKSKFEVVDTGIETFDEAFLANIVSAGGQTVYEKIQTMAMNGQRMLGAVDEESNVVSIEAAKKGS